jgi:hypothetical protein
MHKALLQLFKTFNSMQNSGFFGNQKEKLKRISAQKPQGLEFIYLV